MIPFLFAEGRYDTRLEAIMDLPKGRHLALRPDRHGSGQADRRQGGLHPGQRAAVAAHAGTAGRTAAECHRDLIDVAGEGGGFILDVGAVADEGKDENLDAMISTAKEYGVYR